MPIWSVSGPGDEAAVANRVCAQMPAFQQRVDQLGRHAVLPDEATSIVCAEAVVAHDHAAVVYIIGTGAVSLRHIGEQIDRHRTPIFGPIDGRSVDRLYATRPHDHGPTFVDTPGPAIPLPAGRRSDFNAHAVTHKHNVLAVMSGAHHGPDSGDPNCRGKHRSFGCRCHIGHDAVEPGDRMPIVVWTG